MKGQNIRTRFQVLETVLKLEWDVGTYWPDHLIFSLRKPSWRKINTFNVHKIVYEYTGETLDKLDRN